MPQTLSLSDWQAAKPIPQSEWDQAKPVDAPAEPAKAERTWIDSAADLIKGAWQGQPIHPIDLATTAYHAVTSPVQTSRELGAAQMAPQLAAERAFAKGNYLEGIRHVIAASTPFGAAPAVDDVGNDVQAGNYALAAGKAIGTVGGYALPELPKGAAAVGKAIGGEQLAGMAERGSNARMVNVMAPKGGQNAARFGNMAAKVAPELAAEPGLGAMSRSGLAVKIGQKLEQAEAGLDAAADARNPHELVDTSVIVHGLEDKLQKLTASAASGPEAHASVRKMGLEDANVPAATTKFSALPLPYKEEVRRIVAEMEEFPFLDRTWKEQTGPALENGMGAGRGARNRPDQVAAVAAREKPFVDGEGGAAVYHDILQGATGTSRAAMILSLRRYVEGGAAPTPLIKRALGVVNNRLLNPESVSRAMLPPEAGIAAADVAGKLGTDVVPLPNQARAAVIQSAINEVKALGPAAPYESLRRIRAAWDEPAKTVYHPSLTQDFDKMLSQKYGARDVTGVYRDVLGAADPKTAAANKVYSLYRNADDVMQAAEEFERRRPKIGRQVVSRIAGGAIGEATGEMLSGGAARGLGLAVGVVLGPLVDGMVNAGPTFQIMTGRALAKLSKSLRSGNAAAVQADLSKLKALSVSINAINRKGEAQ